MGRADEIPRVGERWEYFQTLTGTGTMRTVPASRPLTIVRQTPYGYIGRDAEGEWLIPTKQLTDGCWRSVPTLSSEPR